MVCSLAQTFASMPQLHMHLSGCYLFHISSPVLSSPFPGLPCSTAPVGLFLISHYTSACSPDHLISAWEHCKNFPASAVSVDPTMPVVLHGCPTVGSYKWGPSTNSGIGPVWFCPAPTIPSSDSWWSAASATCRPDAFVFPALWIAIPMYPLDAELFQAAPHY